jgi:hypothetical protein
MATTIEWAGGDGANAIVPAESGNNDTLGFFGAGFGFSIRVGEWNQSSFVTNDNGTTNFGQVPNLRFANTSGTFVAGETVARELLEVDNDEATLRIRLNTDSSVQTQNASFRAFDRLSINSNPSGVTIRAAEIDKPNPSVRGSGDTFWTTIAGSGSTLALADQTAASSVHDWYLAITASPTSIGEKTSIGYYVESEFL